MEGQGATADGPLPSHTAVAVLSTASDSELTVLPFVLVLSFSFLVSGITGWGEDE